MAEKKKSKRLLIIPLFVCVLILVATGCATNPSQPATPASVNKVETVEKGKLYTIEVNSDKTYNFQVKDINGNVLVQDKNLHRQPVIEQVSENLLKISVQTGLGSSTRWSMYADVVSGCVSDGFYYVLTETADKVVCVEYYEQYNVVVRDIFDSDVVIGGTVLEDVYATEPVVECEILDKNKIRIVYLKGKDYVETELFVWI